MFYSVRKWSKTVVFETKSDLKVLTHFDVPLKVFLNPGKYSWFETKYIFKIRFIGEIWFDFVDQLTPCFLTDEFFLKYYPRLQVIEFRSHIFAHFLESSLRDGKMRFSPYFFFWRNMVFVHPSKTKYDSAKVFLNLKYISRLHLELISSNDLLNKLEQLPNLEYLKIDVPFQHTNNTMGRYFTVLTQKFPDTIKIFILRFLPISEVNSYGCQNLKHFGSTSTRLVIPDVTGIEYQLVQFNPPFVFDYFSFPKVSYFNLQAKFYHFMKIEPTISIDITTLELSSYEPFHSVRLMKLLSDTLGKLKHLRRIDLDYWACSVDQICGSAVVHSVLNIFINYNGENMKKMLKKGVKAIERMLSSGHLRIYNTESIFNARYELAETILQIAFNPSEDLAFPNSGSKFHKLFQWVWVNENIFKTIQSLKQLEYFRLNSKNNNLMPFSPHFLEIINENENIKQVFVNFGLEDGNGNGNGNDNRSSYSGINVYYDLKKNNVYPSTFCNVYRELLELPFAYCIGLNKQFQNDKTNLECVFDLEKMRFFAPETKQLANDWMDNWIMEFKEKSGPEFDGWI
ncbi:uncharacterized protein SAPINGB_P004559 [Magnusiomyces paraingens]|uniref:Uncharacterized protein n=1 Tax=Magnusiomyces paraingens TaxID=2606893 RepID=A0A5E8BVA4_9ASCO|nr:uncharacterized protein SAPINGB_P004559 [Saprochaete ingens]VVT55363.1 unnamed protein product [Saprochaete ingens]